MQENGGDGRAPGGESLLYVPRTRAGVAERGHFAGQCHLVQGLEQPGRILKGQCPYLHRRCTEYF